MHQTFSLRRLEGGARQSSNGASRYLPALDGFRALSIGLVVLSHAGLQRVIPGGLGALLFFVISGFLLTRQVIVEIEPSATLSIRAFYLRRLLRLAPALLAYIFLFTIFLTMFGAGITPIHILSGIFYFSNYYDIFIGYPMDNPFPILWSLAVEEHFYIIFPFFAFAFRRNLRGILPWLYGLLAGILAWRFFIATQCADHYHYSLCGLPAHERIFHGTDTIADCILYGVLTALLLHCHPAHMRRLLINRPVFVLALLTLLGSLLYRAPLFRETLRFSIQSISCAAIIVNVLFGAHAGAINRFLSHPVLLWLGRMSYSLYLFHFGVLNLIHAALHVDVGPGHPASIALYLAGSFSFAAASYALIEMPFARLRLRFGSHNKD